MRESVDYDVDLPNESATVALAARLAGSLPGNPGGWLVVLQGELGAGKSTFARAMLREYGHEGPVPSPTYTLVEPYALDGFSLYHVDLYRVSSTDELEFLGWSDLAEGLRLVEWPERVPGLADEADIVISLRYANGGRSATLSGGSARGQEVLSRIDLK